MGGTMWVQSTEGQGSIFSFTSVLPFKTVPSWATISGFKGKRIILVTGNKYLENFLLKNLTQLGTECSIEDSVSRLKNREADLILVDVNVQGYFALAGDSRIVFLGDPNLEGAHVEFLKKPIKISALHCILEEKTLGKISSETSTGSTPSLPFLAEIPILLVEDNTVNQKVIKGLLRKLGCSCVDVAEEGQVSVTQGLHVKIFVHRLLST